MAVDIVISSVQKEDLGTDVILFCSACYARLGDGGRMFYIFAVERVEATKLPELMLECFSERASQVGGSPFLGVFTFGSAAAWQHHLHL